MYDVKQYASNELPVEIAAQFASFVRLVWLSHLKGEDRFWTLIDPTGVTQHFVISERGVLITHVAVGQRRIEHLGESYDLYTLGGVFTYPAFRGEGHGQRAVDAASDYIRQGTGDMGMLFCVPERWNFYGRSGWQHLKAAITFGDPAAPQASTDEPVMILPISSKVEAHRADFERAPIYVGVHTW